jgi:hypothetical protein
MRFTFVILLFCCLGADAQMIIKAHPNYVPFASANLLLDQYSGAEAAYSLRKLRTAYTGNAIRVRRSNDNTEQDIGFTSAGDLDTASLKTFVGANSGFVTTWYDQSNARNATQTTAANQPRIVNAGTVERRSGDISLFYDGSNDILEVASTNNLFSNNNISHYAVSSRGNTSNSLRSIYSTGILTSNASGFGFLFANSPNQDLLFQQIRRTTSGQDIGAYTNTINNNFLIFGIGTSSIDYAYYNGGNETTISHSRVQANNVTNIILGARRDGAGGNLGLFLNGTISEIVFWQSNQSSNRTGIETNINSYYGIY